jgi:4-alpha-glucanotransferase
MSVALARKAILLPVSALPGDGPIGTIGKAAFEWIDFLAEHGFHAWQILPLNAPDSFGSPYSSWSSLASSPWLLPTASALTDTDRVDYSTLAKLKGDALRETYLVSGVTRDELDRYAEQEAWVRPHLEYALKGETDLYREIFFQMSFDQQWAKLKTYAESRGIEIVGDLPLFVSKQSADVALAPQLFKLGPQGELQWQAGAPPDEFAPEGQAWGVPNYEWDAHRSENFAWWKLRLKRLFDKVHHTRIDHFLGLNRIFERNLETGVDRWAPSPGRELLQSFDPAWSFWAENLGIVTEEAEALRRDFKIPGMTIMQFQRKASEFKTIYYTGTHDNQTMMEWASTQDDLKSASHLQLLELALSNEVEWFVFPIQDLMGLGSEARFNTPGTIENNWSWRLPKNYQDHPKLKQSLKLVRERP